MLSHDGIAQLVLEDHSLKIVDEALHWMKGYHEHLRGTGESEEHAFYNLKFLKKSLNSTFIKIPQI